MSGDYNYERFDAYVERGDEEPEFAAFPNMLHSRGAGAGRRVAAAR